ncbi:MAG: transcription elongation factor GreA [Clostridia bacterium]|nr:transcription elongation factor GreA [Clostridia bacterium]MBQ6930826.1 transcription elongation factor GreA [Clostridia bacterium]
MAQELTREGYDKLAQELEHLKTVGRKEAAENIKEARSHGDLSENAEYDEAMNDQGRLEARITELEGILKDAIIISDAAAGLIHVGSVVTLKDLDDDEEDDYVILGENESSSDENYISAESPAGKALMGKQAGDTVVVDAPGGQFSYQIVKIIK